MYTSFQRFRISLSVSLIKKALRYMSSGNYINCASLTAILDVWLSNNPNCVSKFNQDFSRHTWNRLNTVITLNFSFNYILVELRKNQQT